MNYDTNTNASSCRQPTSTQFTPCESPYELVLEVHAETQWWFLSLIIIPVGTLFGNGLVILAVVCQKNLRNISNRVIASLALTDFLLALFVVPLGIYQLVLGEWKLGLHMCITWTGSDVILSTTSIMHLCSIALYRYHGIAHPFRGHKRNKVSHLIVPAWIVSIALSIPFIIQAYLDPNNVLENFRIDEKRVLCGIYNRTFTTYSSLVSFFIPLVVMSTVDILSVQTLRRQASMPRAGLFSSSPEKVTLEGSFKSQTDSKISDDNFEAKDLFAKLMRDRSRKGKNRKSEECPSCSDRYSCNDERRYDLSSSKGPKTNRICYDSFRSTTAERPSEILRDARRQDDSRSNLVDSNPSRILNKNADRSLEVRETTPLSRPRSKSLFYLDMLSSGGSFKINGRERRAEKTLIWVFAVFVILWLPFFCTNLIYGVCHTCNVPPGLFQTFVWLGYLSSGVNPCIYTLLNRDFRTAFYRILTCKRQSFRREIIMSQASMRAIKRNDEWTPSIYLSSYRRPNQN